jgi:stage V sporulation protein B
MSALIKIKNFFGNRDSLAKQSVENSAFSLLINTTSKVGGLIFSILLARALLPDLFGLYSLIFSIVTTILTFTDLGINTALSRYLSESLGKGKKYEFEARSRVRFLFSIKIILSFVISLILFIIAPLIANSFFHKPEITLPLRISSFYLFVMGIQGFFGVIFYPLRKLKYNFISEVIIQLSRIVLFLLLIKIYTSVSAVFIVLITAFLLSTIFYFIVILIKQRKLFFGKTIPIEKRKISIFLGWSMLFGPLLTLFTSANVIILGFFVENNFIGYYTAICSIVFPIASLVNTSAIFLPIFTEIKKQRLRRGFKKVMKYFSMLAFPTAIGLAFVVIPVLRVLYGPSYVPTQFYIPVLISSVLTALLIIEMVLSSVYHTLLISKEKMKFLTMLAAIIAALNIILGIVLIKLFLPYGQVWAIVAISITTIIVRSLNICLLGRFTKREFKLVPCKRDILNPLCASIVMLIFLFAFDIILKPNFGATVIMVILASMVYFVALYIINRLIFKNKHL